jgi:hypothetical protein
MNKLRLAVFVLLVAVLATTAWAKMPTHGGAFDGGTPTPRPTIIDNTSRIDANNIEMIVTNHGSFAYELTSQTSGMWFPRGTENTCVYASGLWVGCQIGGKIHITAGSFAQEYGPGPILADGSWADAADPRHKVYKIYKGDVTSDDYLNWPDDLGAPVDAEGKPLLIGDQTLWCVYNDADPALHVTDEGSAGETPPLGIEVQQTTFAFDWKGALGNTVFIKFKVINKGENRLDSTYVAVWADPDLGGSGDDYVGCDTDLSMGFVYNATNGDQLYGSNPPAVGYDFFQGPMGDLGQELPMVSFNKYINGTDPRTARESYNYMRGLNLDGSRMRNPLTGEFTTFAVSGDPVANSGWLDSDPADRRFMLNSGPFTMAPGDTQEVVIGIVVGQGSDRIGSVRVMKFFDQSAQIAFDLDFDLPAAPDNPVVVLANLDRRIRLSWGDESEVNNTPGYTFEGYNVYQSASISAAGPWRLIATYDLVNNLSTIEDLTLDINFGLPITEPVQFGTDYGIQRYIEITEDKVLGVPLSNGTPYYYKVGAYSYNPTPATGLPKTLESFSPIITAIPQEPVSDAIIMEELDDCTVVHGRVDTDIAASTDKVSVFITNPFELTGHTYRVDFQQVSPPETVLVGNVPTPIDCKWNLRDKTTGLYLYDTWQYNKTGDGNYEVTDGFLAKVIGAYTDGGVQEVVYVGPDGCHQSTALASVDAGLGFGINGSGYQGAGYGADFRGSSLDPVANADQFTTVEIRFSRTATQKAYRYTRPGYAFSGVFDVPFTVWDVNTGAQLNAGFVENQGLPTFDGTWGPDASDLGGREYLFIDRSEYDPNGEAYGEDPMPRAIEADVLYAFWVRLASPDAVIEDGSILRVVWGIKSTDNDYFEFTPAAEQFSSAKAKDELDNIRVVPNPYFAHSSYELNQFGHVVKFNNLPERCTIRIFNLAGDLVKTLEKDTADTSIMEWNLFNEADLPIASGFYIYHVDAPGVGNTFGKMAIFMEKERLNTF